MTTTLTRTTKKTTNPRIKTTYHPNLVETKEANRLFGYFEKTIQWEDGVKSKNGFTRKAKMMNIDDDPELYMIVCKVLKTLEMKNRVLGVYMNHYRTGLEYTPNHSHIGMFQVIISLGVTRTLMIGKKAFPQNSGDVTVFGSVVHGVPREPQIEDGRISIALFLEK